MMEGRDRVFAYPMIPPPAVRAARINEVTSRDWLDDFDDVSADSARTRRIATYHYVNFV